MNAVALPSPYAGIGGDAPSAPSSTISTICRTATWPCRPGAPGVMASLAFSQAHAGWFERARFTPSRRRSFPITPELDDPWALAMTRAITAQENLDPALSDPQ